jgi:hypothetical protein
MDVRAASCCSRSPSAAWAWWSRRWRALFASAGLACAASAGLAAWCALLLDRTVTGWMARRLPMFETQTVRRAELVGAVGRVVLAASERGGVAQVRDARGDLHQVTCRLAPGEHLSPGAQVLLIEYDERSGAYLGEPAPFELAPRGGAQ